MERSDSIRYRVYDGTATSTLPHDLGHLIVERETGDHGGFWGAVAAGVVFASMEHLDGRRPPHAAERSTATMRERSDDLRRAELMVWLTGRIARDGVTSPERVRIAAREALSTFPGASVDENAVLAACRALQEAERRWAALTPGEELVPGVAGAPHPTAGAAARGGSRPWAPGTQPPGGSASLTDRQTSRMDVGFRSRPMHGGREPRCSSATSTTSVSGPSARWACCRRLRSSVAGFPRGGRPWSCWFICGMWSGGGWSGVPGGEVGAPVAASRTGAGVYPLA